MMMNNPESPSPLPGDIHSIIHHIRGDRVLLDEDLASLYGVETKRLNEQVRRNPSRFPPDFMFQLSEQEWAALRSQFATSNTGRGGRRHPPYAFTEQGVAMLSSVLNSERAVAVNVEIMRAFVRFRHFLANNEQLAAKFNELEMHFGEKLNLHDRRLRMLVEAMRQLRDEIRKPPTPSPPKRRIGFLTEDDGHSKTPKAKKRRVKLKGDDR